jgi:hypothetical protein
MAFTKVAALKITNPVIAIVAVAQAVSGLMMAFFSESIPFAAVRQVHLYSGYVFVALFLLHLYLNLPWIKSTYFKKKRQP